MFSCDENYIMRLVGNQLICQKTSIVPKPNVSNIIKIPYTKNVSNMIINNTIHEVINISNGTQ
jgi:hypothetical protein